jgi:sucrose-phosphate synthase
VAPNDGGPKDIIGNCRCGLLVDPTDTGAIAAAAKKVISDNDTWKKYSKDGILNIRKYYTWESHAATYVQETKKTISDYGEAKMKVAVPTDAIGKRLAALHFFIVTDIDHTLIGKDNPELHTILDLLQKYRKEIGFGVATGRTVESTVAHLKQYEVPPPDVIISSVGSEIYYGPGLHAGRGWTTHISAKWNRSKMVKLLDEFDFLTYQDEATQRKFKISYDMEPAKDRLAIIHDRLLSHKCRYNLIYSHNKYLDILPYRASKGKAIRYLSYKWEIPLSNFLVCGDSGNDEEMLRGEPRAVVVGNYSSELKKLKNSRKIYFAKKPYAGGILEAIEHYRFIEKVRNAKN